MKIELLEQVRASILSRSYDCRCGRDGGPCVRYYVAHEGVPEGEKPSSTCEDCGGRVMIICMNYTSEWPPRH